MATALDLELLPVGCSLPGSSVHGDSPGKNRQWVAYTFSKGTSNRGTEPGSPALQADSLPAELPGRSRVRLTIAKCEFTVV